MKETVLLNPSMDPQVFLPRQFRRHIFTNVQVRTQHSEAHLEQLKYAHSSILVTSELTSSKAEQTIKEKKKKKTIKLKGQKNNQENHIQFFSSPDLFKPSIALFFPHIHYN